MKNPPLFSDVGQQGGGIFHNLTQGFHYSGSQMLKNKGGFFITGIFHRNSTDRVIPKSSFPDFCIYGKLQATPSDPDRFQAILKNRHGRFSGGDF